MDEAQNELISKIIFWVIVFLFVILAIAGVTLLVKKAGIFNSQPAGEFPTSPASDFPPAFIK